MSDPLLLAQLVAALALCGLVWTVQCVHYPLFAEVGPETFARYHREHVRRITWIVAPLMLVELLLAAWWVVAPPAVVGVSTSAGLAGLVLACWVSTAALQVPLHRRLELDGPAAPVVRRLVATNWVRTAAWSARAAWLVALAAGGAGGTAG